MTASAYVLIQCDLGKEEVVLEKIAALSEDITEARAIYGVHDIIVKITGETMDSINAVVVMIRRIPELRSTITLPVREGFGGKG